MRPRPFVLAALAVLVVSTAVQPARAQSYSWPFPPFDEQRLVSGTFCEYRDTGSAPHFHNAADIPAPDGTPVYAVADGIVRSLSAVGSNAFVRVDDMAYVHIVPAPGLSVGSQVTARQTVVGTIVSGQGHVHLTDGYVGSERQPLREGGGLTPYEDPWAPEISDVRFYVQPTRQRLATTELTGPVEITFQVDEKNAPEGSSTSGLNNGAYYVGFQVLTRDRQTVVHTPTEDGVVFRFDAKPSNGNVHNVFDPLQSSLSEHVYIVTNEVTRPSAWDTSTLPDGDYTVKVFAGDTRGNEAVRFVDVSVTQRDIVPPGPVTLEAARADASGAALAWTASGADDLGGYRLYAADENGQYGVWQDEAALPPGVLAFGVGDAGDAPRYVYAAAVDTVRPPNVSERSDRYGFAPAAYGRRLLIVDGFDRTQPSGSWNEPSHFFAVTHGEALAAHGYGFSTVANEVVARGEVELADYDAVFWLLGDESTADETFSADEQARVRAYLEDGGRLFVSGSEIAWDLGARGNPDDEVFLRDYLKVAFAGDATTSRLVRGVEGGPLADALFNFGLYPYAEDYPDYVTPVGGAREALRYGDGRTAGVVYDGPFGEGTTPGQVVVMLLPFETVSGAANQAALMQQVLAYFFPGDPVAVDGAAEVPARLALDAAYPNPFRDAVALAFDVPAAGPVRLDVYDVLGRRVAALADAPYAAGRHFLTWAPDGLAAGSYFVRLRAGTETRTQAVVKLP